MLRIRWDWISMPCTLIGMSIAANILAPTACWGQTIQLPTVRNFSVQTTVNVPDSGSAMLGSSPSSSWGGVTRSGLPTNRGTGGTMVSPSASVHVSIIDLNALDEAILSSARNDRLSLLPPAPQPDNNQASSPAPLNTPSRTRSNTISGITSGPMGQRRTYPTQRSSKSADYAYMALLNHPNNTELQQDLLGDVTHYLELANNARRGGHWSSAQLFYEQAWKRLPIERQQAALAQLKQYQAANNPEPTNSSKATR